MRGDVDGNVAMSVEELPEFLQHERADVRCMAAEAVSQTAADPSSVAGLVAAPKLLEALLSACGGADEASVHAAAALVNICAESLAVARPRLLAAGAVKIARAGAVGSGADTTARSAEQSAQHVEFCCMLLANLTQGDDGRAALADDGTPLALDELVRLYAADAEGGGRRHLGPALTNCLAHAAGRKALLLGNPKVKRGPPPLLTLCTLLRSSDATKRLDAARCLRNVCFEAQGGAAAAAADGAEAPVDALLKHAAVLVAALAAGLAVTDGGATSPWPDAELYSSDELAGFSAELRAALPPIPPPREPTGTAPAAVDPESEEAMKAAADEELARRRRCREANPFVEPQPEARQAATEALLLLSNNEQAAEAMRAAGLQPLLRQSHFSEWHEPTAEANANLVRAAGMLQMPEEEGAGEEEPRIEEVE